MNTQPDVSFVIPHKGREAMLESTIESIIELDCDLSSIEVFVITQNQSPLDCIKQFEDQIKIQVEKRDSAETVSTLRNTGASLSTATYLAFIDSDIQLDRSWITVMRSELSKSNETLMVGAVQNVGDPQNVLDRIRSIMSSSNGNQTVDFLPGANLFLTRETFLSVGGFPENLRTCEDYYFSAAVARVGKVYCTKNTHFVHLGEDQNLSQLFNKEIWRGQSNLLSLKDRKVKISELPSLLVPIWLIVCFILFFFSALLLSPDLSVIFVGLILLPIVLYTLRLYRLCKGALGFTQVLKFYLVYFPARVIGTVGGLVKSIKT